MQDIGMSPDYRSGVSDYGTCDLCNRRIWVDYLETCPECGKVVCPDCCCDYGLGVECLTCAEMPVLEL